MGDREHARETLTSALTNSLSANSISTSAEIYRELVKLKLKVPPLTIEQMVAIAGALVQSGAIKLAANLYFETGELLGQENEAEVHLVRAMRYFDGELKDPTSAAKCAALICERFPSSQWRPQAVQIINSQQDSEALIQN